MKNDSRGPANRLQLARRAGAERYPGAREPAASERGHALSRRIPQAPSPSCGRRAAAGAGFAPFNLKFGNVVPGAIRPRAPHDGSRPAGRNNVDFSNAGGPSPPDAAHPARRDPRQWDPGDDIAADAEESA